MRDITILVVDDEAIYLELMKGLLQQEGYNNVVTEQNPTKVIKLLEKESIDLVLLDVYMPELNGIELLELIHQAYPEIPVIMVTAVDAVEIALKAIKLGAYEYLTKPPDTDRLLLTIRRALEQRLLELELDTFRSPYPKAGFDKNNFSDIITKSEKMFKIFELIQIFAPTNEIILITGETGTGKDLLARKIHDLSPRKDKPFIAVNLASISASLFESELFGFEKGSFTGSTGEKKGYFEAAGGGTIFLDEIGELPKDLQGKLLRTIQYNEIYRIGNPNPLKLDIKIIAATNKDLKEAVDKKEFRADLFYRLNRCLIQLPPLRERKEDIPLLIEYFLQLTMKRYNKKYKHFSKEIIEKLSHYDFPGNVRELENIIINAAVTSGTDKDILELPVININDSVTANDRVLSKILSIKEAEKQHVLNVLKLYNGNISKAAAILGISDRSLQRRIQKYNK